MVEKYSLSAYKENYKDKTNSDILFYFVILSDPVISGTIKKARKNGIK